MKINSIYISAFGKLKDYTLDLSDGFNVIYGENENGKSTVMAFIKMMFYGNGGRKAQQISANPRLKYLPWDGGVMGGRIVFEHSGHRYRLEREFKKSDSTDRVALYDIDSGCEVSTDGNVGLQFFGLGADAFERSMFVGNIGAPAANEKADGELSSRLSNMVLTGDEDTSYQTVVSRLENAAFSLVSKSGRTGSIVKNIEELNAINERIKLAGERDQKRGELNTAATQLKNQLKAADEKQKQLKSVLERENDIKSAEKLKEYLQKKAELEELQKSMTLNDGTLIDDLFVKKLDFCLTKLEGAADKTAEIGQNVERLQKQAEMSVEGNAQATREKLDNENARIATLKTEKERLECEGMRLREELQKAENAVWLTRNKKRPVNPVFAILGAVLAAAGIVAALAVGSVMLYGGIAAAIVGAVLIILGFVIRPVDNAAIKNAENALEQLKSDVLKNSGDITAVQGEISEAAGQISLLTAALNTDAAAIAQQKADLSAAISSLEDAKQKETSAMSDLSVLAEKLSLVCEVAVIRARLPELEAMSQKQKELKLRLSYLSGDLGGISYADAKTKLESITADGDTDTDFVSARAEYDAVTEEITRISSELSEVLTRIRTEFSQSETVDSLRQKADSVNEKISAQKLIYDATQTALSQLHESFAEVRRGYGSALENETLKIFSRLTNGRYGSMEISKNLEIKVEESGTFGTRELDYLSAGTTDQAYLSLRLAMCALICDEAMPIILDDVLCQYDDRRTDEATAFLGEYSKERQTILFTCHNAVRESARNNGATVTNL